ncbi:aminopeptidase N-like [Anthonomus grandis grandis]|uniref:aminopeptidase N-like n=1 Tax=Anthonomus grandis grandis TaxID=2921223 RepID=UPI0021664B36|nr:aminopeptidase N-like [Anthonomus grandis grandis]
MKQTIATTVAHELAHQWFGNLITCKWWSETYLNEGFATYFQYMIMKDIEPTWEIEKYFLVNVLQSALDVDSLEAPALTTEVSTPEEILSHFGDNSYQKALYTTHEFTTAMPSNSSIPNFRYHLIPFLKVETSSSLVITSDMLEIFQTHVDAIYSGLPEGITLQSAMLSWIEQPGYPLVTASISGKNLTISQQRFLISDEDTISKWYIPITYAESYGEVNFQSTAPAQWLTPGKPEITFEMEYENKWVILNTYQTGFYRVNYDSNLWSGLSQALLKQNFDNIIEENRAQIVDDLFNLVKINKLKYSEVFKIIEFLKNETGYFTWVPAFKGFQYLWFRVQGHPELQAKLKDHITRLMAAFYNTTSISETKDEVLYTQRQLLGSSWACLLEEKTCVNDVRKVFSETVITNNKRPHKNIRSIVYYNALRYSNDTSDFDHLWILYNETEDNSQQLIVLQALACSNNQEKLKELLLETVKDNSKIRSKHFVFVYTAVYRTSLAGVKATLEFLPENFQKILEKYPAINIQENLIKNFAVVLTTTGQFEKFKSFIAGTSEFSNDWKSVGEKALEIANFNLKWFENHVSDLKTYYSIDDDDNNKDKDDGNNEDKGNDTNYSINIRPMELGLMLLSSYIILHSF